jgi:hypothetical protein
VEASVGFVDLELGAPQLRQVEGAAAPLLEFFDDAPVPARDDELLAREIECNLQLAASPARDVERRRNRLQVAVARSKRDGRARKRRRRNLANAAPLRADEALELGVGRSNGATRAGEGSMFGVFVAPARVEQGLQGKDEFRGHTG